MSSHTNALVPLSTWCFNAPDVKAQGRSVDIGLLAEALVYYDSVLISITTQPEFAEWLRWFVDRGLYAELLSLLRDGTIRIYDYGFATLAAEKDGVYSLWNFQDEIQKEPGTFERRFLYHSAIEDVLSRARDRRKLYQALRDKVIEAKSDDFGRAIENARADLRDPERVRLLIQCYVDELFRIRGLGTPPLIGIQLSPADEAGRYQITSTVSFERLSQLGGSGLEFHLGSPLNAAGFANRLLWSAARENCDLFLPAPVGTVVGDKLLEGSRVSKIGVTIEHLRRSVEFPDVRRHILRGTIEWADVMRIRSKAGRFRGWLQSEADRDRDAIFAYHNEVATEAGFSSGTRKAVSLFGVLGGAWVGAALTGPTGATIGAGIGYLLDLASKLGSNWRPVVFGDWVTNRIDELLEERKPPSNLGLQPTADDSQFRRG